MTIRVPHPLLHDPEVQANFEFLEDLIIPSYGPLSSLPLRPEDGDEIDFQTPEMASPTDILWRLKYQANSVSSHKWKFIGGPRWWSAQSGATETTETASKVLPGGPSILVPIAGDYEISLRLYMQAEAEGVNELHGTLAGISMVQRVVRQIFDGGFECSIHSVASLTTGQKLEVSISMNAAFKAAFSNAQFSIQPIRVG